MDGKAILAAFCNLHNPATEEVIPNATVFVSTTVNASSKAASGQWFLSSAKQTWRSVQIGSVDFMTDPTLRIATAANVHAPIILQDGKTVDSIVTIKRTMFFYYTFALILQFPPDENGNAVIQTWLPPDNFRTTIGQLIAPG